MVSLIELIQKLDEILQPQRFSDYCPNGLQVEGRSQVERLVTGVTASLRFLDAAAEAGADAVLVHHGWFWRGEELVLTGMRARRARLLLAQDMSLLAYHLPLDAHPQLGNNAVLGELLGIRCTGALEPGECGLGLVGELSEPISAGEFAAHLARVLGREPLHEGDAATGLRTLGWCTGAAQGLLDRAAALGLDGYLTGEVSEPAIHSAREQGIHLFAAGHHATERYGVRALGEHLARELGVQHSFIDIDSPL